MRLLLFVAMLLTCISFELQAQLDTVHYIPPLHSRLTSEIEDHYIYISTPEINPFFVNVRDGSGAELPGSPFSVSNANPTTIFIGMGEQPSTKLMVGFGDLNQTLTDKGIILSAEKSFYANARYRSNAQAEALTSKGRSSAGTEFRLGMMPVPSENSYRNFVVGIMATQDGTVVTISEYNTGVVFDGPSPITADNLTLNLNEGECYVMSGYTSTPANLNGMIGALVQSNKPIVINSGNMCGTIGPASGGQDMALDQIVPSNKIGNKYIVVEGQGNTEQERPMVVAHYDNTQVFLNGNGAPVATLQAGDWYLINNNAYSGAAHRNMYIYVSEPAYVYQFLAGSSSNVTPGMNFMPPVDCSLPKEVDLIPQIEKIGDFDYTGGILVITETGSVLTLNGAPQTGAQAVAGNPDWETYKILGLTGNVAVNSTGGLAVGIYGQSGAAGFAGFYAGFSSVLDVVVTNDTAFCVQDADVVTIAAEAEGGTPPYVFNWNQGLGQGQQHTVFPTTTTEYIVTVTDGSSCTSTDKIIVSIHEPPLLTLTPDETICSGESITIEVETNDAEEPLEYEWNEGLGNSDSHDVSPESNIVYTVTVTDANGCSSTGDIEIEVHPLPSTEIFGDSIVCEGSSAFLDAGGGFSSYQWSSGENAQIIVPGSTGNYVVTVTDQNNCSATDAFEFEFSINPIVLAGQDQTICDGEPTLLEGEAYGGVEPYTYVWDQGLGGGNIHLVSPEETTTYTLTVVDVLGCSGTDEITINVEDANPVQITGDTVLCEGFFATLDAGDGFLIYTWNTGDVGQTLTTSMPGEYIVSVTDMNGCTDMDTIFVEVQDSLQPVISGILTLCDGQKATLDAGAGYDQYLWSTGDDKQTISISVAGNYSVTVTNTAGCSGSVSVETNAYSNPELNLPPEFKICKGDSLLLVAETTQGEGPYNYSWNGDELAGDSLMTDPGKDTSLLVIVTDVHGCMDSILTTIVVHELPVANAGADVHICYGDTIVLEASSTSGTQPYEYEWGQSLGSGSSHQITPENSAQYTLTITDAEGCRAIDSVLIEVSEELFADIEGQTNFCFGNSSTLSVAEGSAFYVWNTGDTGTSILVDQSGNYALTVSDVYGCSAASSVDVVVQDSLTPQINDDISLCTGDTIQLDVNSTYDSYSWNTGDTTNTIQVSQSGMYGITVYNADGCNGSDMVSIDQLALPVIQTSADESICAGQSTTITATGINGNGPFIYEWDQGLGIGESQEITPDQSTSYTVTVTDIQGCAEQAEISITVLPVPEASFSINDQACVEEELVLEFNGVSIPGALFEWDFSSANVISGMDEGPFIIDFSTAGTYEVNLLILQNGCMDEVQQIIEVYASSFQESIVDACDYYSWNGAEYSESGLYVVETVNNAGCDSTSQLVLSIHSSYDTLIEQIVCDASDVGTQSYSLTSEYGCDSLITEQFYLGAEITVSLGPDIRILFGEEVFIEVLIDGAVEIIDSIYWMGIPGISCPDCTEQSFVPQDSGLITVHVIDENGCIYTDALSVFVERSKDIYAPNIFSPNNDGINDFFNLYGNQQKLESINYLMVFDRWGNKVFHQEDLIPNQANTGWDGNFRGSKLNPGVYVWYAEVQLDDGTTAIHKGDVLLVK